MPRLSARNGCLASRRGTDASPLGEERRGERPGGRRRVPAATLPRRLVHGDGADELAADAGEDLVEAVPGDRQPVVALTDDRS